MCGRSTQNMEFGEFLSVTCNIQIETPYLSYLTIHNRIRTPTNVMDLMKKIETPYLSYLTIHNRIKTPTNVMDLMKRKVNML